MVDSLYILYGIAILSLYLAIYNIVYIHYFNYSIAQYLNHFICFNAYFSKLYMNIILWIYYVMKRKSFIWLYTLVEIQLIINFII